MYLNIDLLGTTYRTINLKLILESYRWKILYNS